MDKNKNISTITERKIIACSAITCPFGKNKIDDYCSICRNRKDYETNGSIKAITIEHIIEFEITKDYFHIGPAMALYKKLREARKETGSNIHLKTSYECMTRPSDYVIDGSPGESILLLQHLINTEQGETIQLSFEPPVSDEYLDNFKRQTKHLF